MRRFIVGSLVAATIGGGLVVMSATSAFANGPTEQCTFYTPTPAPLGQTGTIEPTVPPSTSGELQVCENNSAIVDGTVTANGNANPPGGYIIADGNPNAGHAAGYIGVESGVNSGETLAVVGCSSGDYSNAGPNAYPSGPANTDGANGTQAPSKNDGTTDNSGNNVIVGTNGSGVVQNPIAVATGNCSATHELP